MRDDNDLRRPKAFLFSGWLPKSRRNRRWETEDGLWFSISLAQDWMEHIITKQQKNGWYQILEVACSWVHREARGGNQSQIISLSEPQGLQYRRDLWHSAGLAWCGYKTAITGYKQNIWEALHFQLSQYGLIFKQFKRGACLGSMESSSFSRRTLVRCLHLLVLEQCLQQRQQIAWGVACHLVDARRIRFAWDHLQRCWKLSQRPSWVVTKHQQVSNMAERQMFVDVSMRGA